MRCKQSNVGKCSSLYLYQFVFVPVCKNSIKEGFLILAARLNSRALKKP